MDIVILGSIKQTIKPFEGIAIKEVKQTAVLTDDHNLQTENNQIFFDYLIIGDFSLIKSDKQNLMLLEMVFPIVNFYRQTSCENIYYVDGPEALNQALFHIVDGDL